MKQPISVKIMNFWHQLPPAVQMSAMFILSGLLTLIQQLLEGVNWRDALLTFVSSLIVSINGMQAISKTADKHKE